VHGGEYDEGTYASGNAVIYRLAPRMQ